MDVIGDPRRIRALRKQLEKRLKANCHSVEGVIGFRPQAWPSTVWWDPDRFFWFHFDPLMKVRNKWWCAYGVSDPESGRGNLAITVEINFPPSGIYPRIAGGFAEDRQANVHLVHSGNVGGGRPGINRESFLASYQDQGNKLTSVRWGVKSKEAILIGRLGHPQLADNVARFVHTVAQYKAEANKAAAPR